MVDLSVPIQLAGQRVRLVRKLGSGSSSEVWSVAPVRQDERAEAPRPTEPWVLKIGRPSMSRYLASEAERLAITSSTHLPTALAAGRLPINGMPDAAWNGAPYVLMTRLPGATLSETIEHLASKQEAAPSVNLARCVARDVGAALADLHAAGFGHGDLKPDNIVVERRTLPNGNVDFACGVVDLGLSTERGSEVVSGGTVHYLPPEVRDPRLGTSDAQSRDIWALGLILREILGAEPAPEMSALSEALLAPTPAARPRASWVAEQAGYRFGIDAHVSMIRRRYLQAQHAFLQRVKARGQARIDVEGQAHAWLSETCGVLTGLCALLDTKPAADEQQPAVAANLTSESRLRFLLRLCGKAALDFPPLPAYDDAELVRRLVHAAHTCPPEAFTYDLIVGALDVASRAALEPADLLTLALQLGADNPSPTVLSQCEHVARTTTPPLVFVLRLSEAFKRRGELGRARALLLNQPHELSQLGLAKVLARAGASEEACNIARALQHSSDPLVRAEAAAVLARVCFARGDLTCANEALSSAVETPAVLEAKASIALASRDTEQALRLLNLALGHPLNPEQHARLEALMAHLNHQKGDHPAALQAYERAVTQAARAGALLDEATYLVGVASTALPVGRIADAMQAAQRALLLFEFLRHPSAAARAALNYASALLVLGAHTEARAAIADTINRARRAKDQRCEAMAHLLASVEEPPARAGEHVERAEHLLSPVQPSDRLRVGARRLLLNPEHIDITALDTIATQDSDREARLEWWTARAQHALATTSIEAGKDSAIFTALSALAHESEPVEAVARAFAAGAELAARRGDGGRSLQLVAIARQAYQRLLEGAPPERKLGIKQLPWATWLLQHSAESPLRAEQIADVERLVRDLSDRSRLRKVLDNVLDALVRWTGVERGLLLLPAPNAKLVVRAARNLAAQDLSAEQRELSQTLAKQALTTGDCVVAMDASGELSSLHASVHALQLRSVLAIPLTARGETQGVVYLDDRVRRGAFGAKELAWVRLVSTIAAVAIAEARDQARLRRAARRAQRAERQLREHLSRKASELVEAKLALDTMTPPGVTHGMVGRTQAMQSLFGLIARVAPAEIPVFISGESGTGKELVARAIHQQSLRAAGPFVTENCSAIPANLLESILFGHKKGAFTGATHNHAGLFELAHGGTLFLDELGEMSLAMQAKLLRVLETGELRRVGGERSIHVDVRVVGASHRNLEQMVQQGAFREDLYYRLNVITVALPPLRERTADIPELVAHFMRKYGRTTAGMTPQALAALQSYSWPGNVRQLENEIRRAMVLTDDAIGLEHLSPAITGGALPHSPSAMSLNLREHLNALEARLIERALKEANGNQSRAAETLGVSRFGLQKMLKRLGLAAPK